jgi:hypothetical protein
LSSEVTELVWLAVFKSPRDGGNGDAGGVDAAVRAGSCGTLIVLT